MTISINSCAAQETIVVTTRSNVYELVVLGGDRGDVFVRGGEHFPDVTQVQLLGSIADDGTLEPHTIDIGRRMAFVLGDRFVVTSPVQALSRDNVSTPGSVPRRSDLFAIRSKTHGPSVTTHRPRRT